MSAKCIQFENLVFTTTIESCILKFITFILYPEFLPFKLNVLAIKSDASSFQSEKKIIFSINIPFTNHKFFITLQNKKHSPDDGNINFEIFFHHLSATLFYYFFFGYNKATPDDELEILKQYFCVVIFISFFFCSLNLFQIHVLFVCQFAHTRYNL